MPTPPYEHPLKLAVQTVATIVLWTATALIVAIALRRAAKERSALTVIVVLAVAIGSLIEPLYDIAYHLLWYVPGHWTLFTSFNLPQPVWVMPAYVTVFAGPTLYLYPKFAAGVSRREIVRYAALTVVTTAVFETAADTKKLTICCNMQTNFMDNGDYPLAAKCPDAQPLSSSRTLARRIRVLSVNEILSALGRRADRPTEVSVIGNIAHAVLPLLPRVVIQIGAATVPPIALLAAVPGIALAVRAGASGSVYHWAVSAVAGIGVGAFAVSFLALRDLVRVVGYSPATAWISRDYRHGGCGQHPDAGCAGGQTSTPNPPCGHIAGGLTAPPRR